MENLVIHKNQNRDTATLATVGMLAYRIFPDTASINIQLLSGAQEACTIPFKNGEQFVLREKQFCLKIIE